MSLYSEYREAAEKRIADLEEQLEAAQQALALALDCKGSYNGTVSDLGGDPALCTKCEAAVRAALYPAIIPRGGATEDVSLADELPGNGSADSERSVGGAIPPAANPPTGHESGFGR